MKKYFSKLKESIFSILFLSVFIFSGFKILTHVIFYKNIESEMDKVISELNNWNKNNIIKITHPAKNYRGSSAYLDMYYIYSDSSYSFFRENLLSKGFYEHENWHFCNKNQVVRFKLINEDKLKIYWIFNNEDKNLCINWH
ncbi:hypothetical protein L1281_002588 [Neisseria sp. HSC-16F19]|nr:hypothetical protein [Neisseria sp. HSC-16F19]MCP2041970.1 hypothetical protein [Neisseria sp. HSC-16F19]